MKLAFYGIDTCFEFTDNIFVNSLVVENPNLFWSIIEDISKQCDGYDGKAVLSVDGEIIRIDRNVEIIDNFVCFDLNQKTLITKIAGCLEKNSVSEEHYLKSQKLLANIEQSIFDWAFDLDVSIAVPKLSVGSLLRASGIEICDDYDGARGSAEKIIDYMELVRRFDKNKLFVFVNMRSFFDDEIVFNFINTVIAREFNIFMIESVCRTVLSNEKRIVVDDDMCLI